MSRELGLIWAEGADRAIGRDGSMPWHLPEDLQHFKATTFGAPVIMGRRTWESLPPRFRPLPGRENIVVTRDASYIAEGASVQGSLEAALNAGGDTAWLIGGGELYRQAMPVATELVITRIDTEIPDADTFAPEIRSDWQLISASERHESSTGLWYRFERYRRTSDTLDK